MKNSAQTVRAVEEIGRFFRKEWIGRRHFVPWPFMPAQRGKRPTLQQANHFFLGCCVDLMTWTWVAWENARRFCEETVPKESRARVWDWIAHKSAADWAKIERKDWPHRYTSRHKTIHEIAKIMKARYGGDARKIWEARGKRPLLGILEDELKVGPGIARMIIGALRDHALMDLKKSDFKPDRHVIRLMNALSLAASTKANEVLRAATCHFDDPWLADICFYNLGAEYDVKSKEDFFEAYETVRHWKRVQKTVRRGLKSRLREVFRTTDEEWSIYADDTFHWAAAYVVRDDGLLATKMNQDAPGGLWVWIGVGFNGKTPAVALDIGGALDLFETADVRGALRVEGLARVRGGHELAKNEVEYWRSWDVDRSEVENDATLNRAIEKTVGVARAIATKIEAAEATRR